MTANCDAPGCSDLGCEKCSPIHPSCKGCGFDWRWCRCDGAVWVSVKLPIYFEHPGYNAVIDIKDDDA